MPTGIIATVDDGYATVDFVNPALRGPGLKAVIDIAGPHAIETITRKGPRRQYKMLVGNAQAAGLLDGDEPGRVRTAGPDLGAAAALVAADPNVNAGADHADWHTPYDEYTSANKYVGTTTVTAARAAAAPAYTGRANAIGGTNAGDTPTHAEVIAHVKRGHPEGGFVGSTPGGEPVYPDPDVSEPTMTWTRAQLDAYAGDMTPPIDTTGLASKQAVLDAIAANPPAGEPSLTWLRIQLDAYAAAMEPSIDTTGLADKQAVLDAIAANQE
ncbi:hypothetical protein AVJ28_gp15 [Mycobacterium phage Baee]|uniref:Uncharacterized protein n=1 Tax=Mycobacterium phage Baee TaxID=1647306 RepID=A0A0F6WE95_9CAUD|nr:hypothetical protein AVJ28_gp15 [Mycobacterium phage Baee]AKF14584.1 hypothetical protein SEA_BAEE_15 [Mycobacterium phage Baee]